MVKTYAIEIYLLKLTKGFKGGTLNADHVLEEEKSFWLQGYYRSYTFLVEYMYLRGEKRNEQNQINTCTSRYTLDYVEIHLS